MANIFRGIADWYTNRGKKKKKKDDLRSARTKATQKAAGDTDVSHMITPGVAPKKPGKKAETPKKPERKIPNASLSSIVNAAERINKIEAERKKRIQKAKSAKK